MNVLYFDWLPTELFSEIIKYIHSKKVYINFISVINNRITRNNYTCFDSKLFNYLYVTSTINGKLMKIELFKKCGYSFILAKIRFDNDGI